MMRSISAFAFILLVGASAIAADSINVRDYGAVGNIHE